MPNLEPVVIAGDRYSLRLVGPKDAVWPSSPNAPVTVLANSSMVARPLPMSNLTSSPDFVAGTWTGRLGDAGEGSLTFPNKDASDGVPWRQRFDPTGHLQFVEIYRNGELDFCGVIDAITTLDRQQVQIHCYDGMWLLKKAYERDWTVTQAPRDVIERGSRVWVPMVADDFPAPMTYVAPAPPDYGSLTTAYTDWTVTADSTLDNEFTLTPLPSGGVSISVYTTGTTQSQTVTLIAPQPFPSSAVVRMHAQLKNVAFTGTSDIALAHAEIGVAVGCASLVIQGIGNQLGGVPLSADGSYDVLVECDGEWCYAFVNGRLISCQRANLTDATDEAQIWVSAYGDAVQTSTAQATITSVLVEQCLPALMAGSDKGDYVLPGVAGTYPTGGLHARYFNDLDLQSNSSAPSMILSPTRQQSYGVSSPAEYANQQDPQINGQNPPGYSQTTPGPGAAPLQNWSCRWFGAIYLKLSAGNYTLQWQNPGLETSKGAVRVWIGKTQFGTQLVDGWSFSSGSGLYTFTVSAATLAGSLPYGAGTVQRDGWYPIKIEFAQGSATAGAGTLALISSPAAYTDPGGTAIAAGSQSIAFPSTSLSPLGCVDQRYQGIAHFDLVQQTAQAYGYQLSCEPKQLESGLFPGVLAPRIREGHDTDIVLSPDLGARQDGEGILNYSSGLDASDFACSLTGNGAGFQNGNTGQLQATVFDPPTMLASLFDCQQWQDFSDASFDSLLQALLNSQLGLQLEPWQLLSADPHGRPRQSYTWPLPGKLQEMRWRPGDGLRIDAPDINVVDASPRQMLTITRNLLPNGTPSTQASFALRPRTPAHALKQQLYKATRLQRNYQRQLVTLAGGFETAALAAQALDAGYSGVLLLSTDQVVGARLRITENTGNQPLYVHINSADQTNNLGGAWTVVPVSLDVTAYAVPTATFGLYAQLYNNGTAATTVVYQLVVDVLR